MRKLIVQRSFLFPFTFFLLPSVALWVLWPLPASAFEAPAKALRIELSDSELMGIWGGGCYWKPGSDNLATTPGNWVVDSTYCPNGLDGQSRTVYFDGSKSSANCTWDYNGAGVASITAQGGYAGTVSVTTDFNVVGGFGWTGATGPPAGTFNLYDTLGHAHTMTVGGDFTLAGGNFQVGAGTLTVNGPTGVTVSGGTFDGGTGTVNTGSSGAGTGFILSGGTFTTSTGTVNIGSTGGFYVTGGTFTPGSGTIKLNGSGAQEISCTQPFNNLTCSTSGTTKSSSSPISTNGTLQIDPGVTLNTTAVPIVYGTYINNGTHSGSGGILMSGSVTVAGSGSVTNTGSFTFSGPLSTPLIQSGTNLTFAYPIAINGALTVTNQGTVNANSDITGNNSNSTWSNDTNSTLNIKGALLATGTLTASATGNTVNYNGTAQTIKAATYSTLTLSGTSTKTAGGNIIVSGTLTVGSGVAFDPSTYTVTGNSGSNVLNVTGTARVTGTTFGGTYVSFETVTLTSGSTIDYSRAGDQTIDASLSYGNLRVSGSGTKTLTGSFTIRSTLVVTGSPTLDPGNYQITTSGTGFNTWFPMDGGTIKVNASTFAGNYNGFVRSFSGGTTNYCAANQTIDNDSYWNLTTSGSGVKSLGGAGTGVTVNGDLNILANTTLDTTASNYFLRLNGSFSNSGTFNANASPIYIGGSAGNPSIASFGTDGPITFDRTSGTATMTGAISSAGSLTVNGAGGTFALVNSKAIGNWNSINGNVTLTAGTLNATSSGIIVGGNWTGTGNFTCGTSIVQMTGANVSGSPQIASTATTFYELQVRVSGKATDGGGITINENLKIDVGTLDAANKTLSVQGTTDIGNDTGGANAATLLISDIGGTRLFVGQVTIHQDGRWNNTGNDGIVFRGGITNNGTFNSGTGIQTFNTNSQAINSSTSMTFAKLTVTGTIVGVTNNLTGSAHLIVSTSFSGTGYLLQGVNSYLVIGDPSPTVTLLASASGNTVEYTASGSTVLNGTYWHLIFSGSGTKTPDGTLVVDGDFYVNNTSVFAASSYSHSFLGNWTIASVAGFTCNTSNINFFPPTPAAATSLSAPGRTIGFYNLTLNNTSGFSTDANLSIASGGYFSVSTGVTFTPGATCTVAGAGTLQGGGQVEVTRIPPSAGADFSTQYSITNKTLTNLTVDYAGTDNQSVSQPTGGYGRLSISMATGKTATAATDITASNIIGVHSGIYDANGHKTTTQLGATIDGGTYLASTADQTFNNGGSGNPGLTLSGSGILTASSGNIYVKRNWLNSGGTFNAGTSTVYFNSSSNISQLTSRGCVFNNVDFNGNGQAFEGTYLQDALTVNGNLTIESNAWFSAGSFNCSSSFPITITGNWSNSGGFGACSGTVTFNGSGAQSISGSTSWYGLTITATTARAVSMASGSTQTILANGSLTLTGADHQLLTLASSTGGTVWNLLVDPTGVTQSVSYVYVSDSNAGSSPTNAAVNATNCTNTDGGGNTNWDFGTCPQWGTGFLDMP